MIMTAKICDLNDINASLKMLEPTFDLSSYTRLSNDDLSTMQVSQFTSQLPALLAADNISSLYSVSFPDGLPQSLTKLKQGGFGSMIKDPKTGSFVGNASFYEVSLQASLLSCFSVLSIVTGQYFLKEINNKFQVFNQKIDKILEFLYGDKRAELLSEISFVKYTYENYSSIIRSFDQRIATITSLQSTRKIAIKDIEFYINDLQNLVTSELKFGNDIDQPVSEALQISDSINMSLQLYYTSNVLEILFAQNYNQEYIDYLEAEITSYIEKCDTRILSDFNILKTRIHESKPIINNAKTAKENAEKRIEEFLTQKQNQSITSRQKELHTTFEKLTKPSEYVINTNGEIFYKVAS